MSTFADIFEQEASESLEDNKHIPNAISPESENSGDAAFLPSLKLRLQALDSYFRLSNLPLSDAELSQAFTRNYIDELRIARDFLLSCAEIIKSNASHDRSNRNVVNVYSASLNEAAADLRSIEGGSLVDSNLYDAIREIWTLCDALTESEYVSFRIWSSLEKIIARRFTNETAAEFTQEHSEPNYKLSGDLFCEITKPAPEPLCVEVEEICKRLLDLLEILRHIEKALSYDEPLKQTLPFFTLLRERTASSLSYINERASKIESVDAIAHQQIDGVAYAIRMEMRKAFEHELVGLSSLRNARHIYARIENAHGLLRDCFQQSLISLAQAFDPHFDGERRFSSFSTKLEQSLSLRRELWGVLEVVRSASAERDQTGLQTLSAQLTSFQSGGLRFLMYKDWEAFERFADELAAAKNANDIQPILHRFQAFLETLFSQVNMRAVLANHPFIPPTSSE